MKSGEVYVKWAVMPSSELRPMNSYLIGAACAEVVNQAIRSATKNIRVLIFDPPCSYGNLTIGVRGASAVGVPLHVLVRSTCSWCKDPFIIFKKECEYIVWFRWDLYSIYLSPL